MKIPENIDRNHLIDAIKKIDTDGVPSDAQSKFYDVLYEGKRYPPKLIASYANLFANGEILDRNEFRGGAGTACFKLLEGHGFQIVAKDDIYPIINAFLNQVYNDPTNLKTSEFKGIFKGLQVEAGFGKGNIAAIPWIALLAKGQKVSEGIYPVYLYYKEEKELLLAYGISETKVPGKNWREQTQTISDYFLALGKIKPKRYGGSFFFRSYKIDDTQKDFGLKKTDLNRDIQLIIEEYAKALKENISNSHMYNSSNSNVSLKNRKKAMAFNYSTFLLHLKEAGLQYHKKTVLRFVSALAAKPFVILTGLSGSGKTKLAISFAQWITEEDRQICVVPVGADWTNREPLLGFPNMQQEGKYIHPENGVLSLILRANKDQSRPYFLILDEMNLSHVERYFADFLSCMESQSPIHLHPGDGEWQKCSVPPKTQLPPNLFIIGTVNIDETTYMFSPKVLDRASVIEFRILNDEMSTFLSKESSKASKDLAARGANMEKNFMELATSKQPTTDSKISKVLLQFFTELRKVGAEFGYRSAHEILLFINVAGKIEEWSPNDLVDAIIMQKLLPRLHGSRRKLEDVLRTLASFCLENTAEVDKYLDESKNIDIQKNLTDIKYPISLEKIQRMYFNLLHHSFTSYAEA
ncbi:MrcB family domain-containing protein [Filimonas effusa]|uniref:DUF3578 domain-containing protein n=1 Tax=Filimonas effusa TaxID=2508721 RepID=A0A4Q1D7N6_9BACT|nr:DUF3578 domain-containing protein [Filimonas effusa]RXK83771.1 DUF3578 domain-containing protein [Filimonas effusa]